MIRITFIVPYPEMKGTVEEAFNQHPDQAEIARQIIVKTFEEVRPEDLRADIVIARGYTANLVRNLSVPLIDMTVTGFDVTVALDKCLRRFAPKRAVLVGPLNVVYGVEEIENVFDCGLECRRVDDPNELENSIRDLVSTPGVAVISGHTGYLACRRLGVNGVMIESGKKTIRQAIDEAVRSIRMLRMERERSDRFKSIMDYTFEGIVTTDRVGKVTTLNKYAQTLFGRCEDPEAPVNIADLLPGIDLSRTLCSGRRILGEVVTIRDRTFTVNCAPAGDSGSVITFTNVAVIQELEGRIRKQLHPKGLSAKYSFTDIIGKEPAVEEAARVAKKFSSVDSNIFIFGETGTGKELFAQSIHNASSRRDQPFVAVNCAALAEDLLESELFGYVEGAFTGASKGGKIGLFELAHNGTIFLDEIGDISPKLQSRLLRVIQEREIMRLGHDRVIPVNIRIVSASNKDLKTLVGEGKFREDLLYRLNVLKLYIPPLRARKADIPLLCDHFFTMNRERLKSAVAGLNAEAGRLVEEYDWPGNVRELCNFCERISVLCDGEIAEAAEVRAALESPAASGLTEKHDSWEKELIINALNRAATRKDAARMLGVDPSTLWRKMKKLKL